MSKKRRRKTYREPTRGEWRLIRGADELDKVFSDTELVDLLDMARRRIVTMFYRATERRNGKHRRTDNYIIGIDGEQHCLAHYVLIRLREDFVSIDSLPEGIDELSPMHLESIVSHLQYRLIAAQIDDMVDEADIWYDEGLGIWQSSQRCHDAMLADRKMVKRAIKFDRRHYHGRPRRQARRRNTREGDSISYARQR